MNRFLGLLATALLAQPAFAAPSVSVSTFDEVKFYPTFSAPAEVISANDSALSAEIAARIIRIEAEVGDQVKSGDELVRLDCSIYESQLAAQKAMLRDLESQLRLATDQYKRAKTLFAQKNLGEDALQQRETALQGIESRVDMQNAQIDLAEISVDRCVVKAPFNGVVSERSAQLGSLAAPGSPLLQLTQVDGAELEAKVRPDEILTHAEFQFVTNSVNYALIKRAVLPIVDRRERTQVYRFTFPERTPAIGATGRLIWTAQTAHVPANLMVRRAVEGESTLGLMVEKNGIAEFMAVPEAIEGQSVALDLPGTTKIITDGRLLAVAGEAVEVRN